MAVRRIVPKKLDKASLPTEYETFTNAYFHEALKYRLWIGPTQPPADKTLLGDIWRQDNTNPHVFRQLMPNGTWSNMLAGTEYPISSGFLQSGFMSAADGALLNNATVANVPDTLMLRDFAGGTKVNGLHIDGTYGGPSAAYSSVFSTLTQKNTITLAAADGNNDPGYIIHETSGTGPDTDKGVLHLVPSDNNTGVGGAGEFDHVAIGLAPHLQTNYTAKLRLFVDGRISSAGQIEAVSFNSTSTIEAKENIYLTTMSALDLINQTTIVDFNFKGFDEPKIGFIAEHTNSLLSGPEQNIMDHSNAIGILMKAVQELSAEVEELKSRLGE